MMLSDVDGRITHVFLAVPAFDEPLIEPLLACFRGIRASLADDVRYTVLHRSAQTAAIQDALGSGVDSLLWDDGFVLRLRDTQSHMEGRTLRITRLAFPDFTNWVQDAFLVDRTDDGTVHIRASPRLTRLRGGWDEVVPRKLAEHLGWSHQELPAAVAAGNLLVDRDVVVGSDVCRELSAAEWKYLEEQLGSDGRRIVVPAADQAQPLFHLDLYVTLAGIDPFTGRPRALVGSVRKARELVPDTGENVVVDYRLDAVAADLEAHGYDVWRVPLLPFTSPFMPAPAAYSYNNCLVEHTSSNVRRVTLPVYGNSDDDALAALDRAAESTWSSLGYEVRRARGAFAYLAELGGSVRCMTKVLARET